MPVSSVVQKFLPPSLNRNMNKLNVLNGDEPNEQPMEWNSQPTAANSKSRTSPSKTNPVISAIMGRLNHHAIDNGDVEVPNSDFPVESHSESVTDPDTTPIESIYDDGMDHLLELFHSKNDEDILDVELQMLQAWLVAAPPSEFNTVSTVLFHKYGGKNIAVTNCMSQFYMFVLTNTTVKLANGNTGHAQGIGIILCLFLKNLIIYTVRPVYYCPGNPSNTISSGALKFDIGLKILHLNLLNIATLLTLKVVLGDQHIRPTKILTIFN